MVMYPEGTFYQYVKAADVPEIIEEHIIKGRPVERLMYKEPVTEKPIPHMQDIPFFGKQMLIALKNRGLIDAEKIDEYIARDGYMGAAKALIEMKPDEVIDEVKKSGLRGRGGGGFPTGMKWSFARKAEGDVKYILCNADEGDPGAFMDRSVLEADPHAVLEGMIIAGYAIGASQGYIYCRAEYPLAIKRLNIAIEQATRIRPARDRISWVQTTAWISTSIRAQAHLCAAKKPRSWPPSKASAACRGPGRRFRRSKGLWSKPSVLNNVETFANVAADHPKGRRLVCLHRHQDAPRAPRCSR